MRAAFIPARAGSKRVQGKNMRQLAGHPLLAYSIASAHLSGCFDEIVVVTDCLLARDYCKHPDVPAHALMRSPESATDTAPDLLWIREALDRVKGVELFAILRPTSPFRRPDEIQRAMRAFTAGSFSSLRAISRVTEHPEKMWRLGPGELIVPVCGGSVRGEYPEHSLPGQCLAPLYVQNASLELVWADTVTTIDFAGDRVRRFRSRLQDGFDINTEDDWVLAEYHAGVDWELPSIPWAESV